MAQAYKWVVGGPLSGKDIRYAMGRHRKVQLELRTTAYGAARRADSALNNLSEERTGDSYISVERSEPDYLVTLNDQRGQAAANIIEFGRKGNKPESANNSPSRGVRPLQLAFGMRWD